MQSTAPDEWGVEYKEWMDGGMIIPECSDSQFLRQISTTLRQKHRLVTTENGRLCLAPDHTEKGDSVFILLGCSVPLVLKRDVTMKNTTISFFWLVNVIHMGLWMEKQWLYCTREIMLWRRSPCLIIQTNIKAMGNPKI